MRGGFWILGTCGIVGLVLSVGSAQEFPFDGTSGAASQPGAAPAPPNVPSQFYSRGAAEETPAGTPQPPGKYTRSRRLPRYTPPAAGESQSSQPRGRGFLDELFNGKPTRPPAAAATRSAPPSARNPAVRPAGYSAAPKTAERSGYQPPPRDPQVIFPKSDDELDEAAPLQNADFEDDSAEQDAVRAVRATDDNVSPFARPGRDTSPEGDDAAAVEAGNAKSLPLPETAQAAAPPAGDMPQKTTVSPPAPLAPAALTAAAGGPQSPMLTIHWTGQGDINVGQECHCQLHVTNSGKIPASNVAVNAFFPPSVRLTKATPVPTGSSDQLTWELSELAPGEEKVIDIRMIPSKRGDLATTAYVTFTAAAGSLFRVNEPLLAVTVDGPKEIQVGDSASQIIKVSNPGTGVATNVKLEAIVPAGLEHLRGERLTMEIGSLNPGETRVVQLALASVGGGEQVLNVQVAADGDLRQNEAKTINVVAPTLSAGIAGSQTHYVGRTAEYVVTVTNDSSVASNNVRAMYKVPAGYSFLRTDNGGRLDAADNTVSWFVGRLEPGKSAQRTVYLTASEAGSYKHVAAVTSEHGATAGAEYSTSIEAVASLSMQIVEREDPVKVGTETAFEVRVKNDGSKPAENVGLSIELPAGVKYQSARGPSEHLAENGLLVFKSVERLDPGKTAVYRVYVQGAAAGDHRLRARVASDSIGEPLIGEEQTHFTAE